MDHTHLVGLAAHFPSPAMSGHNTGTQIGSHGSLASLIQATAKLTPQQIIELEAG